MASTGEVPSVRFARDEASRLKPIADRLSFRACWIFERRVRNDCAVKVDGVTVPLRLIGEQVEAMVAGGEARVRHGAREVAVHT